MGQGVEIYLFGIDEFSSCRLSSIMAGASNGYSELPEPCFAWVWAQDSLNCNFDVWAEFWGERQGQCSLQAFLGRGLEASRRKKDVIELNKMVSEGIALRKLNGEGEVKCEEVK